MLFLKYQISYIYIDMAAFDVCDTWPNALFPKCLAHTFKTQQSHTHLNNAKRKSHQQQHHSATLIKADLLKASFDLF